MMKMPRKYVLSGLLLALAIAICDAVFAQAKLEGRVLDENGNGLPAASVKVEDLGLHIHTDTKGFYLLPLTGKLER